MAENAPPGEGWNLFQDILKANVTPITWQTWLRPLRSGDSSQEAVTVLAPTDFHLRWLVEKYGDLLEEAIAASYGPAVALHLEADPESLRAADLDLDEAADSDPAMLLPAAINGNGPLPVSGCRLVGKYRFESFVVGPSNRFAHAASMAVAEQPGSHYNPLFIVGGAGLGKTHLLNAVGHAALELYPGCVVRYVSSENFFNEFIDGIRRKRMDEFKHRYRTTDVLLLDDVQFFEGRSRSSRSSSTPSTASMSRGSRWSSARTERHATWRRSRTGCAADSSGVSSPTSSLPMSRPARHPPQEPGTFAPRRTRGCSALHRRARSRQCARARGSADPSHCLRGAHGRAHRPRNGERRPSGSDSNRRSSTAFARGHHLDVGRLLRVHPCRSHRPEQASAFGDGPADRDVPLQRAHQPLRFPRLGASLAAGTTHGPLRRREGQTAHPNRPGHIRAGHGLVPAPEDNMTAVPTQAMQTASPGDNGSTASHPLVERISATAMTIRGFSTYPQPPMTTTTVRERHQQKQGRNQGAHQSRA